MSQDRQQRPNRPLAPLISGIFGGAVSTALLLPLDVVKVRMQVYEEGRRHSERQRRRHGSLRIIRGILKHEGLSGLYQGLTPALIGSTVSWGGYFFLYEAFKEQLRAYREAQINEAFSSASKSESYIRVDNLSSWDNFQLACAAGAVMVGITNPMWLIKLRMQLQMKKASEQLNMNAKPYTGVIDAGRTIIKEEGFSALYKGAGPALLLTSHGGVQFVVYEYLKKHFNYARAQRQDSEGGVMERLEKSAGYLAIGALSKIAASTTTYPLQVMKSRMQQRSEVVELTSDGDVRVVKRTYSGIAKTAGRIWKNEGISGFFKGCIPNAIRVAPSAAITFVTYEATMDLLDY